MSHFQQQSFKKKLHRYFLSTCITILFFSSLSFTALDLYYYADLYTKENVLIEHLIKYILLSLTFLVPIILIVNILIGKIIDAIYGPIQDLTNTADRVNRTEDFSLQAKKYHDDEIGILTDTFNNVITKVHTLEEAHEKNLERTQQSAKHYLTLFEQAERVNRELEKEAQDRLQAEHKLQHVRVHLNDIINSMPSGIICVDEYGTITEWNKAIEKIFEISIHSAIGRNIQDIFVSQKIIPDMIEQTLLSRQLGHIEKYSIIRDDREKFYDVLSYPLTTEGMPGVVIKIEDVTTQVRLQDMMVQTEKMMSVGGLAAGMAHEINNPLGAIMQGGQNIIRRLDANTPANRQVAEEVGLDWQALNAYLEQRKITRFLDNILDAGNRAATIVANMLQFSRKSDHNLLDSNMVKLVDRVIDLAANDYDLKKDYDFRKIEIVREYQENLPLTPCIASEIEQVLLNLFRNAAQAMNESKTPNQRLILRLYIEQGKMNIEVEDNGPGMSAEVQRKIFEPFYTTKGVGVGTGLGLSVSFFIIADKHGGSLTARSEMGKGTCFNIALPLEVYIEKTGTE